MTIDVGTLITNAIAVSNDKSTQANTAANAAMTAALSTTMIPASHAYTNINIVEPPVYIPPNAVGVDSALYSSTYSQIMNDLTNKFSTFFTTYFPIDTTLMNSVEAWLQNAVVNGGSGINKTVEDQIWQRDRDRLTRAASSSAEQATALWAAKGYPLPPGAAAGAVLQINRDRDQQIVAASRDRAIKSWEMEYENIKFAIQQAIDFRVKAVQAAAEYIRTLSLAPQIASQIAVASINAQSNLINAASSYYNARIRAQEVFLEKDKANAQLESEANRTNAASFNERTRNMTNAAVAIAGQLGTQAAASLNSINGTVQVITSQ